jgi:hypothetical protein
MFKPLAAIAIILASFGFGSGATASAYAVADGTDAGDTNSLIAS